MPKYKLCPACNTQNAPWLLECGQCEADLTAVSITDAHAPPPVAAEAGSATGPRPAELCRRCECGAPNPPQARKCALCGEDIADIRPQPYCETPAEPVFTLQDADGFCFTISEPECVLGRAAVLGEYLKAKSFVSRRQAKLNLCNGVVFIENLSATNPTFVNNEKLADGQPVALRDGDEIGLGGKRINGAVQPQAACLVFKVRA